MHDFLYLDSETFSEVPLKRGFMNYVEAAEVMLLPYAFNDGDVQLWDITRGEQMPNDLYDWVHDDRIKLVAHQSAFDRRMFDFTEVFPGADLSIPRWEDTMVQALAHGLPGGLDLLCKIFGVDEDKAKDKRGRALIQLFCKPNPRGERNTEATHPVQWVEFRNYAKRDVSAMRVIHRKMPRRNYPDRPLDFKVWEIDQRINQRGFLIDTELATAAVEAAAAEKATLAAKVQDATHGEITAGTQGDALLKHIIESYGITLPDMRADTVKRRIEDESLPLELRQLLDLRVQSNRNSASKYKAALNSVNADGRLRDTLQFSGAAGTGRWGGRVFQPQNMMRPTMGKADIEAAIKVIKTGIAPMIYDNLPEVLGNCVRGLIIAPPGKKLIVNDYSSIEGRGLAYLAGEEFVVDFYRSVDAGLVDYDSYMLAYAICFGIDPATVTKAQRQLGKPIELAFGYGGGVASFLTFAMTYHLDLAKIAESVWETGDPARLKDCNQKYEWAKKNGYHAGLPQRWYAAFEYVKQVWRDNRPATVAFWAALGTGFKNAIHFENKVFAAGPIKFMRQGHWLYMRLPSGRCLTFLQPTMKGDQITFMGLDRYTRQWKRQNTHGGKLSGLATQAMANDILRTALPKLEDAGYETVLTVHDEAIAETPDTDEFTSDAMAELMTEEIEWLPGFPLASDGFETARYRKE